MPRRLTAGTLLVTLMVLSAILALLFLHRSHRLHTDRLTQQIYQHYLSEKLALLTLSIDEAQQCRHAKQETVRFPIGTQQYRFHCEFKSLFRQKPTKEKFIFTDDFSRYLNPDIYAAATHPVRSVADFPPSHEQAPQILITLNPINERLTQDFYGIILTDYPLTLTDRKIYGTIYSRYPNNDPNRRNLSYKRQVIEQLDQQYGSWHYLPYSRNLLNNE